MKKYFTTPIYYVNDKPHLGHGYTSIIADVLCRYYKQRGHISILLTGTDEHGQKVYQSAKNKSIEVDLYVKTMRESFLEMTSILLIEPNFFIHTNMDFHIQSVKTVWNILFKKGFIYKGTYSGWYSVAEETFFKEQDLSEGKTPMGYPVEWVEEETYFLKLTNFKESLKNFYHENPGFLIPDNKNNNRTNEVLKYIDNLEDLSISRKNQKYGIEVPNDPQQTIYVWFDALINYISYLGFGTSHWNLEIWKNTVHIIGKDILMFHGVIWPAILMGLDLPLPKNIIVHGWWLVEGQKMSKSKNNTLSHINLISDYQEPDFVRYILLREINLGSDGNLLKKSALEKINGELLNKISNLVARTATINISYNNGIIPGGVMLMDKDVYKIMDDIMLVYDINSYIKEIISLATECNELIEKYKPWNYIKDHGKDPFDTMDNLLYSIWEYIYRIAYFLHPICPNTALKIFDVMGIKYNWNNIKKISGLVIQYKEHIIKKIN